MLRMSGVDRYCCHTLHGVDWEGVYFVTCVHFSAVTRAGLFIQKKEEMMMMKMMMMILNVVL
jgi:hypothetical protein